MAEQAPAKSKRRRSTEPPSPAALQLAGLLHVMRLLGAEASDAPPPQQPTPRSARRAAAASERALGPALVDHIVEALYGRRAGPQ